jgi:DNA polymerase III epsilon subunit-like protein
MSINWFGHVPAGVDFETTGLQAGYHEIIQVGVAPMKDDLSAPSLDECFYQYVRPEYPERQDPAAAAVHGIDLEWLMDTAPSADEVADWLREFFREQHFCEGKKFIPIAHNWPFENSFFDAWIGVVDKESMFHYHVRDTAVVCGYLKDKQVAGLAENNTSVSLTSMCSYFGIPNDRPHDALNDALVCAELYRLLVMN